MLKFQTVEEKVNNTDATGLTARQQRLVLRAVVGSLLISAALSAAPPASAQTPAAEAQEAGQANKFTPINVKPFADLLSKAARLHADGLISSDDTFEITFEAERGRDGSIRDLRTTSVAAVNGRWPELMREFAAAIGESRLLESLQTPERLSLKFKLDDRGALAGLSFEAESAERAHQLARGYELLLHAGAVAKRGRPEEAILRSFRFTANGKQFAVTFETPREQLGNLLRQSLAIP